MIMDIKDCFLVTKVVIYLNIETAHTFLKLAMLRNF